jgi:hypothetical protein
MSAVLGSLLVSPVAPLSAQVAGVVVAACRCGHGADAHSHWRAGTDCSACGCGRFQRERATVVRR